MPGLGKSGTERMRRLRGSQLMGSWGCDMLLKNSLKT